MAGVPLRTLSPLTCADLAKLRMLAVRTCTAIWQVESRRRAFSEDEYQASSGEGSTQAESGGAERTESLRG
jgi:hypothetical protein